eukprot:SAG22_NODE_315_length_12535_cov_3.240351_10_plen_459_part_00
MRAQQVLADAPRHGVRAARACGLRGRAQIRVLHCVPVAPWPTTGRSQHRKLVRSRHLKVAREPDAVPPATSAPGSSGQSAPGSFGQSTDTSAQFLNRLEAEDDRALSAEAERVVSRLHTCDKCRKEIRERQTAGAGDDHTGTTGSTQPTAKVSSGGTKQPRSAQGALEQKTRKKQKRSASGRSARARRCRASSEDFLKAIKARSMVPPHSLQARRRLPPPPPATCSLARPTRPLTRPVALPLLTRHRSPKMTASAISRWPSRRKASSKLVGLPLPTPPAHPHQDQLSASGRQNISGNRADTQLLRGGGHCENIAQLSDPAAGHVIRRANEGFRPLSRAHHPPDMLSAARSPKTARGGLSRAAGEHPAKMARSEAFEEQVAASSPQPSRTQTSSKLARLPLPRRPERTNRRRSNAPDRQNISGNRADTLLLRGGRHRKNIVQTSDLAGRRAPRDSGGGS